MNNEIKKNLFLKLYGSLNYDRIDNLGNIFKASWENIEKNIYTISFYGTKIEDNKEIIEVFSNFENLEEVDFSDYEYEIPENFVSYLINKKIKIIFGKNISKGNKLELYFLENKLKEERKKYFEVKAKLDLYSLNIENILKRIDEIKDNS